MLNEITFYRSVQTFVIKEVFKYLNEQSPDSRNKVSQLKSNYHTVLKSSTSLKLTFSNQQATRTNEKQPKKNK